MLQPENIPKKYDSLFNDIDQGRIKIPKFQRDFVWTSEQTTKLIDSIIKGFPIGSFVFWKTREQMRHIRNIGNVTLPDSPRGDAVTYVLDGQQRITSLYAIRKGARITKDGREMDYKQISINLAMDPNDENPVVTVESPKNTPCITVYELLNGSLGELAQKYGTHLEKIDIYRKRLTGYDFSTIVINEYPIDIACEVFTRINTGGTELTLFEIMVAKTYDQDRDFDLAKEYDYLIDNNGVEKDLENAGYDTIPASIVLQCIAAYLVGQVRAKDILKLDKVKFIEAWPTVKEGIFTAVDYLRTYFRIPVSLLLPYPALLVPFTYFFIRQTSSMPSQKQNKLLEQYFFWASLSNRFSSGVEGKLAQDLDRMDKILAEELPSYHGEDLRVTVDDLKNRWFTTSDAFCRAILCIYAFGVPKSFASNSLVKLDNSWLKVNFSKNYHHFFPKDHLSKTGVSDELANSILNITLVDDYLNKRKIKARAPSTYMAEFKKQNPELDQTMRTHYIDNMDKFGIWEDDYVRFLEKRGQRICEEIKRRLEPNFS